MSEENQQQAKAVGHIPSGLFIVCAKDKNQNVIDGYLASWVQQISFYPLMVSIAIKPGRPAYDIIKNKNTFTINVVGDKDKNFMKHFWKGYDPNNNPFAEIDHTISENGGVIINAAKSTIECELVESVQPGDHEIIFAKVINSYVQDDEAKPLTHIRKSGLDY